MLSVGELYKLQGIPMPLKNIQTVRSVPNILTPEQQKMFKSLRSCIVSNIRPGVKLQQIQEFIERVFTKLGGCLERSGSPVDKG